MAQPYDMDLWVIEVKVSRTCISRSSDFALYLEDYLMYIQNTLGSKKISNDLELIQSDPTSCPQNQKGITKYIN